MIYSFYLWNEQRNQEMSRLLFRRFASVIFMNAMWYRWWWSRMSVRKRSCYKSPFLFLFFFAAGYVATNKRREKRHPQERRRVSCCLMGSRGCYFFNPGRGKERRCFSTIRIIWKQTTEVSLGFRMGNKDMCPDVVSMSDCLLRWLQELLLSMCAPSVGI